MGCPEIQSNIILGHFCESFFWMRLTFNSVYLVKWIPSVMWVDLIQLVEAWLRIKKLILPQIKEDFPAWWPSSWNIFLFLLSDLNWNISFSWVSSLPAFRRRLEPCHQLSWVCSLPAADLETCQPPQTYEPISSNKTLSLPPSLPVSLYIYTHTCIHIHIFLVMFCWKILVNTVGI